ncbi:PhoH family protein [Spirochaeta dissipatitropha]
MESSIVVQDTSVLQDIFGSNDRNVRYLEQLTGALIHTRGNELLVEKCDDSMKETIHEIIRELQTLFFQGRIIDERSITATYHSIVQAKNGTPKSFSSESIVIPGGYQAVYPRTIMQSRLIKQLNENEINFVIGPAGTGKTFLAIAHALQEIQERKYRKLILSRPVVEAGESLGFLPGDLTQKLNPYLKPLYDAMEMLIPKEIRQRLHEQEIVEIAPLAYMRGRSLNNCYIILDEAQNTTIEQMKMFLTRMGENSKMVVTGDITQVDLPRNRTSGLKHALHILDSIDEIGILRFSSADVVRHRLVQQIIKAYEYKDGNDHEQH